jgi:hypothetical protein
MECDHFVADAFTVNGLSPLCGVEKLHAPLKAVYMEIIGDGNKKLTDARARQWLNLFRSCPTDIYRIAPVDIPTHSLTLREDVREEADALQWTTSQRVQMVMREQAVVQARIGKEPDAKTMEQHFQRKVTLASGSERLSDSFVGMACTVANRILSVPSIAKVVQQLDNLHKGRGPCHRITKFQAVANKARTEGNILWSYNFMLDSLKMSYFEPDEFSQSKMNEWILPLGLLKLECKNYFLTKWCYQQGFTPDEISFVTASFANHASYRSKLKAYPDQEIETNELYFDRAGKATRKSFRIAINLWEDIIYGNKHNPALRTANKNSKSPEELLSDYQTFGEQLNELKDFREHEITRIK